MSQVEGCGVCRLRLIHRPGTDDLATATALLRARVRNDFDAVADLVSGLDADRDRVQGLVIFLVLIGGLALLRAEGAEGAEIALDLLSALERGVRI